MKNNKKKSTCLNSSLMFSVVMVNVRISKF